jgi:hypothetical protein
MATPQTPALPIGMALRKLGEHRLSDLARPERFFQVVPAGLPADFPPLRSVDALPHNLPLQPTSVRDSPGHGNA